MECVLPMWYDVRIIIVMRESVARNTENIIKNSGFALTALYKLVPFQPPPTTTHTTYCSSTTLYSLLHDIRNTVAVTSAKRAVVDSGCVVDDLRFSTSEMMLAQRNDW